MKGCVTMFENGLKNAYPTKTLLGLALIKYGFWTFMIFISGLDEAVVELVKSIPKIWV